MVASAAAKGRALVARVANAADQLSASCLCACDRLCGALGFYSDEGIEIDFVAHRGGWSETRCRTK